MDCGPCVEDTVKEKIGPSVENTVKENSGPIVKITNEIRRKLAQWTEDCKKENWKILKFLKNKGKYCYCKLCTR